MEANASPAYAVEIPSNSEHMPEVIDRVVETLYEMGTIAQPREGKVRICMQEAIVNAIRHGNKGQVEKSVRVEVSKGAGYCSIKVFDEGEGFDSESVTVSDSGSLGGRGIHLMRHFMDAVTYDGDMKCLELRINMPQQTQGG